MFETCSMTLLADARPTPMPAAVSELQARIRQMQATKLAERSLPMLDAVRAILPEGLRPGGTYSVTGSTSLAIALLAGPSRQGAWCGALGLPTLSTEAAAELGIDLDRLVLVPSPDTRWMAVAAAMTDVLDIVIAAPPARMAPTEAARLAARLRQRESTLVVLGDWPHADASIRATTSTWSGLGAGHGHLTGRRLRVEVTPRGGRERTRTLTLPLDPEAAPSHDEPSAQQGLRLAPELAG
jgi:hypothetical protein